VAEKRAPKVRRSNPAITLGIRVEMGSTARAQVCRGENGHNATRPGRPSCPETTSAAPPRQRYFSLRSSGGSSPISQLWKEPAQTGSGLLRTAARNGWLGRQVGAVQPYRLALAKVQEGSLHVFLPELQGRAVVLLDENHVVILALQLADKGP
jgi:hypothetical protein